MHSSDQDNRIIPAPLCIAVKNLETHITCTACLWLVDSYIIASIDYLVIHVL